MPLNSSGTHILGYRTTLREGKADVYRAVHATIPERVAVALRDSGVISWRIWQDELVLFHQIETVLGRDDMLARMARIGPIDPNWDVLVHSLVDDAPTSSADLTLVWEMVGGIQGRI